MVRLSPAEFKMRAALYRFCRDAIMEEVPLGELLYQEVLLDGVIGPFGVFCSGDRVSRKLHMCVAALYAKRHWQSALQAKRLEVPCSSEVFDIALKYMYTLDIPPLQAELFFGLLSVADFFDLSALKEDLRTEIKWSLRGNPNLCFLSKSDRVENIAEHLPFLIAGLSTLQQRLQLLQNIVRWLTFEASYFT